MTAPDGLTGYETQMPFVHDGLTPAECDTCQREMTDEYGACACSHGKSDHDTDPAHPACYECPREQAHHEYEADGSDGITTSPANDPLTALLEAARFGVRALTYPLNATERRHLADRLTAALAAYE